MNRFPRPFRSHVILTTLIGAGVASAVFSATPVTPEKPAAVSALGAVSFSNSGSAAAQPQFLRGLAALHSFWYEEARDAFRETTKIDPNFALGYWGEALTWNHTLWAYQDRDVGSRILAKIPADAKVTPREKAYIDAARILYGPGDKLVRDQAYAAAMEKIHEVYPDDLDAEAFTALAWLGTVRPGDSGKSYAVQAKAGALALDVYTKSPNHPGAAHYIIHAFDDPDHAILALPAARRYAEIAPEAHHAQHMPSHIFLQLGLWDSASASNEASWAASSNWVKNKDLSPSLRDYHSYHWLTYIYLQEGRYSDAAKQIERLRGIIATDGAENVRSYEEGVAAYIVETQRWDLADTLLEKPASLQKAGPPNLRGTPEYCGGAPALPAGGNAAALRRGVDPVLFTRAYAAASRHSPEADRLLAEIEATKPTEKEAFKLKLWQINALEIRALNQLAKNQTADAIELLKKATALETDTARPSGPPTLIKPSHELLGEVLLTNGQAKEAVKQFEIALQRQPGRALALAGLAKAKAAAGDKPGAATVYSELLHNWHLADATLPALQEAREFLRAEKSSALTAR